MKNKSDIMASASAPTSHRGMDFGIAQDVTQQVQSTYASTSRDDVSERPVPDLFSELESAQLPVISDRDRLQSQSVDTSVLGDSRMNTRPILPQ